MAKPKNYETRKGPGGGAQMYVNGQWLDENLFSPGTGLQGPLSPKQEANAGYAPGSAQTSNNPYLGETPDAGSNLYEPWRTNYSNSLGAKVTKPEAAKKKVNVNTTPLSKKADDWKNEKANAGYTGVSKKIVGSLSRQGEEKDGRLINDRNNPKGNIAPLSRQGEEKDGRLINDRKVVTNKPIGTAQQRDEKNDKPITGTGNTRPGSSPPRAPAPTQGVSIPNTNASGLLNQRRGEQTKGSGSWAYRGNGVWFNTETKQTTNVPPPGYSNQGSVAGGALDQRKNEQNPNVPIDEGNSKWVNVGGNKYLNIYTGETTSDTDPRLFESPGAERGKIVQESSGEDKTRNFGDFGIAETILGYPVREGWVETKKGVWEKDSPTAKKVLEEKAKQDEDNNPLSGLLSVFDKPAQVSEGVVSRNKPLPDREREMLTETLGDEKTKVTSDPRADLANAARWTALAMGVSTSEAMPDWANKQPNIITERLADELGWQAQGYKSAADMLEQLGYIPDEKTPGLWVWPQSAAVTNGSGQPQQGNYNPYNRNYGDGGWGDYGYGSGRSYGSGYGGGSGYGSGGGSGYGLINWRIG